VNTTLHQRSGQPPARRIALALVFGVIGIAILCSLGAWQVRRLHWKEGLLASIHERMASPPETMDAIEKRFTNTGDVDYYPVEVNGHFLNGEEQHFLATHEGASGFYVYTPLAMNDGRFVFINRGFVPYDLKDPAKRQAGQLNGEVTVGGLARNPLHHKPSSFVPDNDLSANIYYWKDIDAMASKAGVAPEKLVPFFIDAGKAPNPGGYPVGGVTIINLPNNHLQYAITWYGLAIALAAVLTLWLWRQYYPPEAEADRP
jgi:surfeit locus 1 family protein